MRGDQLTRQWRVVRATYSFRRFHKWFATIERRKLPAGDYSIKGLEDRVAVERKSLQDLFNCCSPYHSRDAFVRACERLGKLDFAALVIEGSMTKILRSNEFSDMHPNAVFGTIQALAVRWGIQPWFAPSRALAEEITACLLHKAYQLAVLEKKGLPRRFFEGDGAENYQIKDIQDFRTIFSTLN